MCLGSALSVKIGPLLEHYFFHSPQHSAGCSLFSGTPSALHLPKNLGKASNNPRMSPTCVLCSGTNSIPVISSILGFLNHGTVDFFFELEGSLLWWSVLCLVGYLAASLTSDPLHATTSLIPSCDTPKCFHMAKCPLGDKNHCWGENH